MAVGNRGIAGSRVRLRLAADDRLVACIRRGEVAAFEALYDRHAAELLSFCVYMLGSHQDAEDAVQASFVSAYRALLADGRPVTLRPWLFTIARNECLSVLRKRRPTVELNGEVALTGDPVRRLELREEIQRVLADMRMLPEHERAALVMAEVHGLSQREIGSVLGVRPEQVKAYIYQARSNLLSEKRAREADCQEIREELATSRGAGLLRGRLRRHVRSCEGCRAYADGVARQHRQLVMLFPVGPAFALKYEALEQALGIVSADPATAVGGAAVGMSTAGATAELAGGGIKALAVKLAVGALAVGAGAGVGASVLETHHRPTSERASAAAATARSRATGASPVAGSGRTAHGSGALRGAHPRGLRFGSYDAAPTAPPVPVTRSDRPGRATGGSPVPGDARVEPKSARGDGVQSRPVSGSSAPGHGERQSKGAALLAKHEEQAKEQEEDQREREERAKEREEDQREREERKAEGKPQAPAAGEGEEEEHEEVGVSRSPKTPEERQRKREEHKGKREERQRQQEEDEQE